MGKNSQRAKGALFYLEFSDSFPESFSELISKSALALYRKVVSNDSFTIMAEDHDGIV